MWSVLVIITAAFLIGTAFYSVFQQERFIREFTADIRDVIDEAVMVRKDLEAAMENALLISQNMARTLDERLDRLEGMVDNVSDKPARKPDSYTKVERPPLPFTIEELRRAHPYLVVPRLYERGLSVEEIAEILERGKGEVNLILDIYRKREACG